MAEAVLVSEHAEAAMMKASYEGKILVVGNVRVPMAYPIDGVLPLADKVIVVFQYDAIPQSDPMAGRNVLAVDGDGAVRWQVETSKGSFLDDNDRDVPSPYVEVTFAEDGRTIHVYELAGIRHDLDPETGKISNARLSK